MVFREDSENDDPELQNFDFGKGERKSPKQAPS